ncbi:uncharacterized protein FIBRA_00771 [Fibroporia radiculosa]|uniref:Uncharacterized protein n=1 Tax=Fibroporia radiculosa TaxID=599839 RepID=J4I844_9APHY|nr:uncharacterized protein FIBRA_00771 [Fibroporia radiculosa]CCL98766.1 predicted protein [Fibroporia radiculosa]
MDGHPDINGENERSAAYATVLKVATRLLGFPSRVLARMRRLDEILGEESIHPREHRATGGQFSRSQAGEGSPPFPGPLGFLTSGYFCGLFVMALLLNRIHNIVVPSRNPVAVRRRAGAGSIHDHRPLHPNSLGLFFPANLSSTFSRVVFRIPSIYLLGKSLFIWFVLLLQVSHVYPSWKLGWLQSISHWAKQKNMEDICWFTFTSTCVALAVGALTNGLEGFHLNSNSPFNLFSFAFQLHIYASPTTHAEKSPGFPSRPSKHVIITILIPLLQAKVKKQWSRLRLPPTTACALLNLAHFHSIIWTSPSSYPLTNFFPCVVESMLCFIVSLSVGLNVLTQLLVEGSITRPLFGHVQTLLPKMDEDFGIALVRLGTASLETTSVAGFGNEVSDIANAAGTIAGRAHEEDKGSIEIDRSGVVSLTPSYDRQGRQRTQRRGFKNEISNVKAQAQPSDLWADTMVNLGWLRALRAFVLTSGKAVRRLFGVIWANVRNSRNESMNQSGDSPTSTPSRTRLQIRSDADEDEGADVAEYHRFLRGQSLTDDEDDGFEPQQDVDRESMSPSTSSFSSDEDEDRGETVRLYADLSQADSISTPAPMLLAHMTSTSPLTRRRYQGLVSDPQPQNEKADDWEDLIRDRRESKRGQGDTADTGRLSLTLTLDALLCATTVERTWHHVRLRRNIAVHVVVEAWMVIRKYIFLEQSQYSMNVDYTVHLNLNVSLCK